MTMIFFNNEIIPSPCNYLLSDPECGTALTSLLLFCPAFSFHPQPIEEAPPRNIPSLVISSHLSLGESSF